MPAECLLGRDELAGDHVERRVATRPQDIDRVIFLRLVHEEVEVLTRP